jgi:UDP-glucose 4-epimerase
VRILFTGASSFTGFWFVRALSTAGHDVLAVFTRANENAYGDDDVRSARVRHLKDCCERLFDCRFGDDRFLAAIESEGPWDALCHHAADVRDYKSPAFDVGRAVSSNTHRLSRVLEALGGRSRRRIVLTGSVFEGGEGAGSEGLPDFSPYALSKRLTAEMFRHACEANGFALGKFVIPNPFGPYEELRFTAYLLRTWMQGGITEVRTPRYIRDNIHVQWLADDYVRMVDDLDDEPGFERLGPSGYVSTQGDFAERVARELRPRLGLLCEITFANQEHFTEPRVRINTDPVDARSCSCDETAVWDAFAEYYQSRAEALQS